jgi:hypothetical protein
MRYIYVHVLWHGGKTDWRIIPWGKAHLDAIRAVGGVIIGYQEI